MPSQKVTILFFKSLINITIIFVCLLCYLIVTFAGLMQAIDKEHVFSAIFVLCLCYPNPSPGLENTFFTLSLTKKKGHPKVAKNARRKTPDLTQETGTAPPGEPLPAASQPAQSHSGSAPPVIPRCFQSRQHCWIAPRSGSGRHDA